MNINRLTNGIPPAGQDEPAARTDPAAASETGQVDAGATTGFSRAELHGPRQAEIVRESLLALLDRAGTSLGELPATTRQQCADLLASDPFLTARLVSYLEQRAN